MHIPYRHSLLVASLALLPLLAQAHPGHDFTAHFSDGALHPLTGLDHLLAMLAVGLWAAQLGGRLRWAVPASFVTLMLGGAALGYAGVTLGGAETLIALSVIALGLLVTTATRLHALLCMLLTGGFALFHGYAHALESVPGGSAGYLAGMLLSTAALHLAGMLLAQGLLRSNASPALRMGGAMIAACGVMMLA